MTGQKTKKLIAGNWKMNGTLAAAADLARAVRDGISAESQLLESCDFVMCPPHVHLAVVAQILVGTSSIKLGGQDCAVAAEGAYTGDISPYMLKDAGCAYVILGHSERRQHHAESDTTIAAKASLAHAAGLITIICVGETESQRAAGEHEKIVAAQLSGSVPSSSTPHNTVIAYEPVWAIGTGKTATPQDVADLHAFIRRKMNEKLADSGLLRILYGGSVKPDNAATLLATQNVDGALIGGASLKAGQFLDIARTAC